MKVLKRLQPKGRSDDTLANTTEHMLRQSRYVGRQGGREGGKGREGEREVRAGRERGR